MIAGEVFGVEACQGSWVGSAPGAKEIDRIRASGSVRHLVSRTDLMENWIWITSTPRSTVTSPLATFGPFLGTPRLLE